MSKCDCYRVRAERRYFSDYDKGYAAAQGRYLPDYEDTYKGVCLGTKESDVCDCGGNKLKCNFYERVRAEAAEEKKFSERKGVLEEIENLIGEYWGTNPIYYTDSKDKEEADAAKLCCKILEAIRIAQGGNDEKDS